MSALVISNLSKSYGAVKVLHDINLDIPDNAFIVFVGPSGCGKSTLLRSIAGLEDIDSGAILSGGIDVSKMAPVDRDFAMVFQSYALYPQMTVGENIAFPLKMARAPKAEIAAKVAKVAAALKLDALLDRKPADLSGGQRQRVAIGRAILRDPKVFLFDEPLSNLDAELRVDMRLQIAALRRELSATFIYVTHDQVEAMTLADHIVVLRAGRIEQVGTPMELYHKPANRFVAGFIGSPRMNFLNATVGTEGPVVEGETIDLPGVSAQTASIGIRPEHLTIGATGLSAKVVAIENLGPVSYAHVDTKSETRLTVQLAPTHDLELGQTVRLTFDPAQTHLFDVTETRI